MSTYDRLENIDELKRKAAKAAEALITIHEGYKENPLVFVPELWVWTRMHEESWLVAEYTYLDQQYTEALEAQVAVWIASSFARNPESAGKVSRKEIEEAGLRDMRERDKKYWSDLRPKAVKAAEEVEALHNEVRETAKSFIRTLGAEIMKENKEC